MLHESREASAAGSWLSVASALMIGVLVFHGPLAPTLEEQMTRIAGAPLRWSVVHWTAAAALSFHVVVGLLVLTSGSRLTSSGWTLSAWALYTVGALWTVITAVVETTVIASAAAAGAAETFEAWWSFAEGMGSGFSFLALAVAVIAGHEARSGDGIGPTWAAWLGTVAGVGSFTGWALGIWMGIPSGNLLWAVSSMVMMAWTLWFGVGLARGASGAPHASPTG